MLPVRVIQKSIITLVDDADNFSVSEACPSPNNPRPCIYPAHSIFDYAIWLSIALLIAATLLCVQLRKKNRTKLASTILAIPTAIVFIPAVIATILSIIIVATGDIYSGSMLIAVSGFYLCLTSYVLWNTYKMYKGFGDQNFRKIAVAAAIISLSLLILPDIVDFIFNSMGVEATG